MYGFVKLFGQRYREAARQVADHEAQIADISE